MTSTSDSGHDQRVQLELPWKFLVTGSWFLTTMILFHFMPARGANLFEKLAISDEIQKFVDNHARGEMAAFHNTSKQDMWHPCGVQMRTRKHQLNQERVQRAP